MALIWKTWYARILLLFPIALQSFSSAQNEACPSEAAAIETITFTTSNNTDSSLRYTHYLPINEMAAVGAENLKTLVTNLNMSNIVKHVNEIPDQIKMAANEITEDTPPQDFSPPYYHNTCPYRWYKMLKYDWYWRFWSVDRSGTKTIEFCFTHWWVWATQCIFKLCNVGYYPFKHEWDTRLRCFDDYRVIWIPVTCYRITIRPRSKPVGGWISWRWRKVYVPRGCSCRKYWYWLTVNAKLCPA